MNYARIEDNVVAEIIDFDPAGKYNDSLIWVTVPKKCQVGWSYLDGKAAPYQQTKEQLIAKAEQKKQSFLAEANNAIAPLQDAVDLNMATDEENMQLTAWKTYRVYLNRINTSLTPDIDWPEKPQ